MTNIGGISDNTYLVATLWTTSLPLCSFSLLCSSSLCLLSAKYSKIFHDILRYFKMFGGTSKYFTLQDFPDQESKETIHHHHHHHHPLPQSTMSDRKMAQFYLYHSIFLASQSTKLTLLSFAPGFRRLLAHKCGS